MRLSQLIDGVAVEEILPGAGPEGGRDLAELEIAEVRDDSRLVAPGDLFVAVPGQTEDGHRYLAAAAARGAVAAVVQRPYEAEGGEPLSIPQLRVQSAPVALAALAANRYGRPAQDLLLCAITGTNGKTTTNFLIESLLQRAGHRTGLLGTVQYHFGDQTLPAPLTTPGPLLLHRLLRQMCDAGVSAATLEASSHALTLGRLLGLRFRVAAFTNLTQDHLDFHGTMESYLQAKTILFRDHLLPASAGGVGVVCIDHEYGARVAAAVAPARLLTVSLRGDADITAAAVQLSVEGISATLRTPVGEVALRSSLSGRFNLENLAVAAGVGVALGLSAADIGQALSAMVGVPGRMERVRRPEGGGPSVFVDYAHTPDALERATAALQGLLGGGSGRLFVVFGCGGDRDRGKRPLMGQAAAAGADLVVLTSDNPRSEDPVAIIEGIKAGVLSRPVVLGEGRSGLLPSLSRGELASAARGFFVEPDRHQAIRAAIGAARAEDVVLIAGKGHEDYQHVGGTRLVFDDREEAREALRQSAEAPAPRAESGSREALSESIPLSRVIGSTAGKLLRGLARGFSSVVIDSRAVTPGALFVAIKGPRLDGHDFVADAASAGAAGLLVQRGRAGSLPPLPKDVAVIEVSDTVVALGQLGRAHRDAPEIARGLRVIAITGSSGKTTTKELIAAILDAHVGTAALKTEGNLNNHLGVPLTLLRLTPAHRYAVVEMGMSARGEIAYLTALARPEVGVITNVGPVHLESLRTVDNVALAKGELWAGMADGGCVVLPGGPEHHLLRQQARRAGLESGRLHGYTVAREGAQDGAGYRVGVELLSEEPSGLRVGFACTTDPAVPPLRFEATIPLLGAHNADNAGLAVAVALDLDIPVRTIIEGLAQVRPAKHRGQLLHRGGRVLIDDCYNASPMAVGAALRTLQALRGPHRGLFLLGDMLELGPSEVALHRAVGEQAADTGVALLCTLGARAAHAAAAAAARGIAAQGVDSPQAAAQLLCEQSQPGDWILIKGSRGMQLERVLEHLDRLLPLAPAPPARAGARED